MPLTHGLAFSWLGQVLWRKACAEDAEAADTHLTNGIVEILQREEWDVARNMSEFGVTCAKPHNDRNKTLLRVNHAQALLWAGRKKEALDFLNKFDWSATIRDFQLAVAVLREDYEAAGELMRKIGEQGEIVVCAGYIDWPIFREFRKSEQFRKAFKDVYNVQFEDEATQELKVLADKSSLKTAKRKKAKKNKKAKKKVS